LIHICSFEVGSFRNRYACTTTFLVVGWKVFGRVWSCVHQVTKGIWANRERFWLGIIHFFVSLVSSASELTIMYLYDVAKTFVFFVALVFAICVFHIYVKNFTIKPYSPCASNKNKLGICMMYLSFVALVFIVCILCYIVFLL
jgi:hypothetical protein